MRETIEITPDTLNLTAYMVRAICLEVGNLEVDQPTDRMSYVAQLLEHVITQVKELSYEDIALLIDVARSYDKSGAIE